METSQATSSAVPVEAQSEKMMRVAKAISPSPSSPPTASASASACHENMATANIKYRNDAGRQAILSVAKAVHYDFGSLSNILNVSIGQEDLKRLSEDPNIVWVDGEGAVYFIQPPK